VVELLLSVSLFAQVPEPPTSLRVLATAVAPEPELPPSPPPPPPAGSASALSQHDITWTFSEARPAGRFANGDWWVVGPVEVLSVTPAPAGGRHGSMINPAPGDHHAFDSRVWGYQAALTVTYPVTLQAGQSLVSTVSWLEEEPGAPPPDTAMPSASRPSLKIAAVLSVLAGAPPADAFRPPYAGSAKPLYRTSALRRELLPRLRPPPGTPDLSAAENWFSRPWLDVKTDWSGRYLHPSRNMPDYGRDLAARLNDGYLMLLLDLDKELLLVRLVQIGIDLYGLLEAGQTWPGNGGHASGRKLPILFAGLMLDDDGMLSIGGRYPPQTFGEDCQTFFVTAADKLRFPSLFPVIGAPAWGIRHWYAPERDGQGRGYQLCCTANAWHGAVLCARALGLVERWAWPPLFAYTDVYMARTGLQPSQRSWTRFAEAMWDTYRDRF
jgi:hypothetical protein